jgi:hypothetical protein
MSRAQRLAQDAAEAAEVRAYETDPDVVALRIERVRRQVDWMCWSGIVLGLAFTMTNGAPSKATQSHRHSATPTRGISPVFREIMHP